MNKNGQQSEFCRRWECCEPVLWRGLCTLHWAVWQSGADLIDLPGDDRPAPARQVWSAPVRPEVAPLCEVQIRS